MSERFAEQYNKPIVMTGMRKAEGGNRKSVQGCTVFDKGKLHKFHPLFPVTADFIDKAIYIYQITLCSLYYPPYNFERTGCKGCPFNMKLKEQLAVMEKLLPDEYKRRWFSLYRERKGLLYRRRWNLYRQPVRRPHRKIRFCQI